MNSQDPIASFQSEKKSNIQAMSQDMELLQLSNHFLVRSSSFKYSYNFTWMGRPIIQFPQDLIALQEIIWNVKPSLILETGIAHGGSLIFYASMLELLQGDGHVLGIDIDIRKHNKAEIERHPMMKRITMFEGSSTDPKIFDQVHSFVNKKTPVMVVLDSLHTHEHVLKELEFYSPLVTVGSYVVVLDTIVEDMPKDFYSDRPWGLGNNPKTAVLEFLKRNHSFEVDREIENKLLITSAPSGYLKRIKE